LIVFFVDLFGCFDFLGIRRILRLNSVGICIFYRNKFVGIELFYYLCSINAAKLLTLGNRCEHHCSRLIAVLTAINKGLYGRKTVQKKDLHSIAELETGIGR